MMIVFEWPTHGKLTFSGDNTITSAIFLYLLSPPNRVTDRVLLVTYLKTLSDCDPHALPRGRSSWKDHLPSLSLGLVNLTKTVGYQSLWLCLKFKTVCKPCL